MIGCSGLCKTNALLALIKHQRLDILTIRYRTYLYVKDQSKAKYQLLIYEREKVGVKTINHSLIILKQFMTYMETWKAIFDKE